MPTLPITLAEPDAPAPVGDPVPCHLFWALPPEPLPPVLRPDSGMVSLWDALTPWLEADLDDEPEPVPAGWRATLRRLWDAYHEWFAVAAVIALASVVFIPR
jgi:hypothetical protein